MKSVISTIILTLTATVLLGQSAMDKNKFPNCELPVDFVEPEGNKKIRKWLKKTDATVEDLKNYAAVDNNCSIADIKVMSLSEQKGNGNYVLCVVGKEMRYRRTGSVFHRQGVSPVGSY